jgi:uncharacterized protein YqeY
VAIEACDVGAGRQDLADREAAEIGVLEAYLPPALDPVAMGERPLCHALAIDEGAVAGAASMVAATNAVDRTLNLVISFLRLVDPSLGLPDNQT